MKLMQKCLIVSAWAGLLFSGAAWSADAPKGGATQVAMASKNLVMNDDAKCTKCHDEADAPGLLAIGKTKHGTRADGRAPTCVSCHGESVEHVLNSKNTKERPPPDRTFSGNLKPRNLPGDKVDRYFGIQGKGTEDLVELRNEACLTCHQKDAKRTHWAGSAHQARDVACTSCHTVHSPHDKVRDKRTQAEFCYSCHKEQRAQLNKPSHHPIPEGKMTCSDCHNVHGGNPKQLNKASVNETCYTCHMEKRGPFVHNHQPVSEDCSICHNSHGTTAPSLLKARPPFLCQDCHNHDSHPGQAAGLPTGRTTSTSYVGSVGRACMNCHTNIHGGNSTVNSATAGRFRR